MATVLFFMNTSEITVMLHGIIICMHTFPFVTIIIYYLYQMTIIGKLILWSKVHLVMHSTSAVQNVPALSSTSELPALRDLAAQHTECSPLIS